MSGFWSWFIKRFFEKMFWGGIGFLIVAVYCLIKGMPYLGIPLLIFGLIFVAGGAVYRITHKNR